MNFAQSIFVAANVCFGNLESHQKADGGILKIFRYLKVSRSQNQTMMERMLQVLRLLN